MKEKKLVGIFVKMVIILKETFSLSSSTQDDGSLSNQQMWKFFSLILPCTWIFHPYVKIENWLFNRLKNISLLKWCLCVAITLCSKIWGKWNTYDGVWEKNNLLLHMCAFITNDCHPRSFLGPKERDLTPKNVYTLRLWSLSIYVLLYIPCVV